MKEWTRISPFNYEEKRQILKWWFEGNSLRKVATLCSNLYGVERASGCFHHVIQLFNRNGCLNAHCIKCKTPGKKLLKQADEREEMEVMVCAAAELELRTCDIALELSISKSTVCRILNKYGYFNRNYTTAQEADEDICDNNKNNIWQSNLSLEDKRVIIRWHCSGNNLSKIIELVKENLKHSLQPKYDVYYTIQLFNKYGCLRDCERCTQTAIRIEINDKEIDEVIAQENAQEVTEEAHIAKTQITRNEKDPLETTPSDSNFKIEIHPTDISEDTHNPNIPEMNLSTTDDIKPPPLVDNNGIEYIVLEPTMGIVVLNDKPSNAPKRKKLS